MRTEAAVPLRLLESAGQCRKMADFSSVLQTLGDVCDAQAVVLWELNRGGPPHRRYFALAEHFPAGLTWYYLTHDTAPAIATATGEPHVVDIAEGAARGNASMLRLHQKGFQFFCCVPVSLGLRRDAGVTLYRTQQTFRKSEMRAIEDAAAAIPHLFNLVRSEMGLTLLRQVEEIFRRSDASTEGVRKATQDVLHKVTEAFGALESAIYIEDQLNAPGSYQQVASVWPWDWEPTKRYTKDDEGLTAWTIRNGEPLRFLDLSFFEEERGPEHAELKWHNKERLRRAAQTVLNRDVPPLSYICVPIRDNFNRTIGAIRCCVTPSGPHLFDEEYVGILKAVADQIAERWITATNLGKERQERDVFANFAKRVDRLNALSFKELSRHDGPSLERQFQAALVFLGTLCGFDEGLSIRIADTQRTELRVAAKHGKAWQEGGNRLDERVRQPSSLSDGSMGSRAFHEKRVLIDQAGGYQGQHQYSLLPKATGSLHAPILVGEDSIGVLDIHRFGDQPFPASLETIAGLFARHLGIYHQMFKQFRDLKETNTRLQKRLEEQVQIYDDFHHQVSSPIYKAHYLAQEAVAQSRPSIELARTIRSHTRKAEQFAQNLRYFIELAQGKMSKPPLTVLNHQKLVKIMERLAEDQEAVSDRTRKIAVKVDIDSFDALDSITVEGNLELVEHAVMNLLDNASKYSFHGTTVDIRASQSSVDHKQRFFRIAVLNRGYTITKDERKNLGTRGYRGERALATVAGGRGIGLYIVENFMKAMGGRLEIIPTDSRGINEFRLVLPAR
jgi:signal transduction histidine kinase